MTGSVLTVVLEKICLKKSNKNEKGGENPVSKTTTKTLKGTKTEKNLLAAFAGESQARNRYTYFASVAKKAGYEQIAALFLETAENEKEHAKRFFKLLEGGEVEITAAYPAGIIADTATNLKDAAAGERLEWGTLYKQASQAAKEEGFDEVARQFELIAAVEVQHEKRFLTLLDHVKAGTVFKRDTEVPWRCRNCGYVHTGKEAPKLCPACSHPQSYYEVMAENY
ncbi:MAG: rubrerythrin family protein [Elusimicrobia bacterium]|nr:rubrerythrin family protein [Elusimicrobiota bacterium]MBD3412181.1 rubrerythrin family protein [Elusimicrobiota bacterium]